MSGCRYLSNNVRLYNSVFAFLIVFIKIALCGSCFLCFVYVSVDIPVAFLSFGCSSRFSACGLPSIHEGGDDYDDVVLAVVVPVCSSGLLGYASADGPSRQPENGSQSTLSSK